MVSLSKAAVGRRSRRQAGASSRATQGLEFAAGIAHDLKTPIATIATSAELLGEALDKATTTHLVSLIRRQAVRLQMMVQDFSDYVSLGLDVLVLESVDVAELVSSFCNDFLLSDSSHSLHRDIATPGLVLRADPMKLRRILENLLRNAFKYSPDGSSIVVRLKMAENSVPAVVLEVEDQGPGIPSAERNRIFEPFVRLSDTRIPGQGLGLAIVQQLVRGHGGEAWVEPASSGGSRFCVALPVNPD